MKVFGIGFHKTATSSLAASLYMLGYNVTGYFGVHDPDIANKVYDQAYELADRFDAAQDTPWPVLYEALDKRYPNSKFVLTTRPSDRWIRSVVKHFKHYRIPAHQWIYGVETAAGNEETYIRCYEAHNRAVVEYFAKRPSDLLVMDITKGDGWDKLCPFLGVDVPPIPFPSQNSSVERSRIYEKLLRYLSRRVNLLFGTMKGGEGPVRRGVSAEFVRDLVHYHYSTFEKLWLGIDQLTEKAFRTKTEISEKSVQAYLLDQIKEERYWLNRLKNQAEIDTFDEEEGDHDKDSVYRFWLDTRLQFREYIANTSDQGMNAKIPDSKKRMWEIIIHLMNQGLSRRANIKSILKSYDVVSADETFLDFFK